MEERLRELFAAAGCDGFLHVRDLDGPGEVALDADALVVSASVFKVSVALEFFRRALAGDLDPAERVRVDPAESIGASAGLSLFADPVEVSLRDLAVSMLTVSDALATDALLARVGIEHVNELTRSLGLERTLLVDDVRGMFDRLGAHLGFASGRAFLSHAWDDPEETARALELTATAPVCDPEQATRTTPRETTALLVAIWRGEAAPAEACAAVRRAMGLQFQRERIARGFRDPDVRFSGKTGTFGGRFRNEAGVVELPGRRRYAIAIFTRLHALYERGREADDAIGEAARVAVESLR